MAKNKTRKRQGTKVQGASTLVDWSKAVSLHRAGNQKEAGLMYQNILATNPDHIEALHFMGVLYHQCGQSEHAIESIKRAILLAPDYADAHNNLGNILKEIGHLESAVRAYQRVVELVPAHADAWNNLGVILSSQRHYQEADKAFARAIALNPSLIAAWRNRGNLFARLNHLDEAITAYLQVLELSPKDSAAYDALGRSLYRSGKIEQAIEVYQKWLRTDPANSVAQHMLAACSGAASPERASDDYVRDIFNIFAGSFDQVLDQLGYRAPTLIAEFLQQTLPAADASLVIADAGCGTGLCAEFLRPRAKRLIGVDLSSGMLAKARGRNIYDQLVEAELASWLASQQQVYDLIVSADTLCYFGALDQVLASAERAMQPGALLIFTVEMAGENVKSYQLNPNGRYAHTEQYVRTCLVAAKLHPLVIEQVELRRELGQVVRGYLVSARKPIAPTNS